jgi:hypothetical protein
MAVDLGDLIIDLSSEGHVEAAPTERGDDLHGQFAAPTPSTGLAGRVLARLALPGAND